VDYRIRNKVEIKKTNGGEVFSKFSLIFSIVDIWSLVLFSYCLAYAQRHKEYR
jgi:hypothetical protein